MNVATTDSFFASLEARISAVPDAPSMRPAGAAERYLLWVGFLGAGVSIVLGSVVGGVTGLWLSGLGLAIEIAAFSAAFACAVRRHSSSLRHSKRSFAKDLDSDYGPCRSIVAWLVGFGRNELEVRRRYLGMRRESLSYRLGILSGGAEKLGPLPLLVVLYIQLKDIELRSWAALGDLTLVGGFLMVALALVYLMSMMFLGIKLRLEAYEYLLDEALQWEHGDCENEKPDSLQVGESSPPV